MKRTRLAWLNAALLFVSGASYAAQERRAAIAERAQALASLPGQQIPHATVELIREADQIATGTVFFYGRTPVQVNLRDIDWSGAHIHHQEWPAQLNRFFHLRPLAAAYQATRDERYARAARAYIEDWLRGDNYQTATRTRPGDNTLTMSIRLGSSTQPGWAGTLPTFLTSPAFDDAFLDRVFASIEGQARYLSAHLTPYGNWRIAELDALVLTALRLPFLPAARELLSTGISGMRNAIATQFLPDGVHVERTPGYADWMAQVAANYLQLARRFPEADAGVDPGRLLRALDYGAQAELFGVNDSIAPHRDPATFTMLVRRTELLKNLGLPATPALPPVDQVFANAGQVFSRTSWQPGADYLAFDASTWGGGHSHLSRLSFVFRSRGRLMVADPGILTYEMSDPRGPYGKSTEAHSTLNLNGRNQSGADAELLETAFTPETALIQARYQGGYWDGRFDWSFRNGRGNGNWGEHERILFWVKGEYLLVIDSMAADERQQIRNCWQLGPMERSAQDANKFAWWSENPDANLFLQLVVAPPGAGMQAFEGAREPLRGWVGLHGDDSLAAPLIEFRYPAARGAPVLSAVLLAAFNGTNKPNCRVLAKQETARGSIHHLEIALPSGGKDAVAWSGGLSLPVDDAQPFVTDGRFVWYRAASKSFTLKGTYLKKLDVTY